MNATLAIMYRNIESQLTAAENARFERRVCSCGQALDLDRTPDSGEGDFDALLCETCVGQSLNADQDEADADAFADGLPDDEEVMSE